jgi:hypothetical protein
MFFDEGRLSMERKPVDLRILSECDGGGGSGLSVSTVVAMDGTPEYGLVVEGLVELVLTRFVVA